MPFGMNIGLGEVFAFIGGMISPRLSALFETAATRGARAVTTEVAREIGREFSRPVRDVEIAHITTLVDTNAPNLAKLIRDANKRRGIIRTPDIPATPTTPLIPGRAIYLEEWVWRALLAFRNGLTGTEEEKDGAFIRHVQRLDTFVVDGELLDLVAEFDKLSDDAITQRIAYAFAKTRELWAEYWPEIETFMHLAQRNQRVRNRRARIKRETRRLRNARRATTVTIAGRTFPRVRPGRIFLRLCYLLFMLRWKA